ncbi:MAG: PKD domain-containing protein, partial [Anaerolineae bacterium]
MKVVARLTVLIAVLVLITVALSGGAAAHYPIRLSAEPGSEPAVLNSVGDTAHGAADALVKIDPATTTVSNGEIFIVDVRIEGAEDLAGYECHMTFNPAVVQIQSVDNGPFLGKTGRDVVTTPVALDNGAGIVAFAAFSVGEDTDPGADGDGVLATITLEAVAVGTSFLDLQVVRLFDTDGDEEAPATIQDGFVEVIPCVPVEIVSLASDSPVTVGEAMHFTATVSGSVTIHYGWDFGGAGSGSDLDTATPTFTYDAVGEYLAEFTVTNACGVDTDTLEVEVEPVCEPVDIVSVDSDSPVALGETMHFTATVSGSKPIDYTWDFGGSGTGGGTDLNPTFTYDQAGTYAVTLSAENACGQDEEAILVTVETVPDIQVTPLSFDMVANVGEAFGQLMTIANVGTADLTWAAAEDPAVDWLSTTPVSGTVGASGSRGVVLTFNADGLTVGQTYTTTLVISSNDPDEGTVEVPVALEVQEGLPDIEVTPLSFSLVANVGEAFDQLLTISNVGGTDLTWTLA